MCKVSIITPCYNSAEFIGRTIASVRAQTFADWEHIVVDDGSTDDSADVVTALLAQDPRLQLIRMPNGGVAGARNAGFRAASKTSEYLLFLDADDMLEPAMLATLTAYLDAHQDVGMVYCTPLLIDEQDQEIPESVAGWTRYVPTRWGVRALRPQEPETPFLSILGLTTIIPSITLFRRSVYERTPQWDETFGHIFEDADLFLQVALHSKVHVVPQRLTRYRRHASQSTANAARYHAQEQKLLAKWRAMSGLTPEQQAMVCAAWRFREGRLLPALGISAAGRCLREGRVGMGTRFLLGAMRRYAASFLPVRMQTNYGRNAPARAKHEMKILLVTQNYHPFVGGVETQARLIAGKLANANQVAVAAGNFKSSRLPARLHMLANSLLASSGRDYQDDAVTVHALTPTPLDRARMLPIAVRALPRLQRVAYHPLSRFGYQFYRRVYLPRLRQLACNADIIHAMASGYIAWAAQEAAQERGIPFVCTPYVHPHQWGDGPDDVACYKRAQAVIGLLQTDRQYLQLLGVSTQNLAVVGVIPILPPTVAPADFRRRHQIGDAPLVVFVGRMTEYKGVKEILEASSIVWERLPKTRFVFIGPPSEHSEKWFAQADARILSLGKVSDQEKADALAACNLFCMPSTSEILPAVYLEAWSYGKAVIGGKAEGLPELIEGCGGGVTVERTGAAVAQAITALLSDAERSDCMGQRGRELVHREYALEAVVGSLEQLYQRLRAEAAHSSA